MSKGHHSKKRNSRRNPSRTAPAFEVLEQLEPRVLLSAVSLAAAQNFVTGNGPGEAALADFNGDGQLDMAVVNTNADTVSVLLNTTSAGAVTSSFTAKQDFGAGAGALSMEVGDVNGDGKLDIVTANVVDGSISVLLNTTANSATTPTFAAKQDITLGAGNGVYDVTLADVNSDGSLDLAVANTTLNTVSVLLNTTTTGSSTISFSPAQNFATGVSPVSVSMGDINGDGLVDMVVANNGADTVSVLLNTTTTGAATPTFDAAQDIATGAGPVSVSLGDVNGDGLLDLAVANQTANTVSVLLNTTATGSATASFAAAQDFATGVVPASVSMGDLDGDGKPDLVVADNGTNTISVLSNTTATGNSVASFAAAQDFTVGNGPASTAIGDINSDGRLDVAVANTTDNTVSVLLNKAAYNFATGNGPVAVSTADFNGDGVADLALANTNANTVSVLLNTTATGAAMPSFTANQEFATGAGPVSMAVGDINGDGSPDIVVANIMDDSVSVLLNTTAIGAATPSFAATQDFSMEPAAAHTPCRWRTSTATA